MKSDSDAATGDAVYEFRREEIVDHKESVTVWRSLPHDASEELEQRIQQLQVWFQAQGTEKYGHKPILAPFNAWFAPWRKSCHLLVRLSLFKSGSKVFSCCQKRLFS